MHKIFRLKLNNHPAVSLILKNEMNVLLYYPNFLLFFVTFLAQIFPKRIQVLFVGFCNLLWLSPSHDFSLYNYLLL